MRNSRVVDGFADSDGDGGVEAEGFVCDGCEEGEGVDRRGSGGGGGEVRGGREGRADLGSEAGLDGGGKGQEVGEPG